MAIFNEILEGRFNRALQKVFSMKGRPPTPQLAGEITAVLPFFWGSEARYLEGWQRFFAGFNIPAGGAGNISEFRLRNPSGSKFIAVVEKLAISANTTEQVQVLIDTTGHGDLANTQTFANQNLDSRGQPSPGLIGTFKNNNANLGFGAILWFNNLIINQLFDVIVTDNQEFPITPGVTLDIFSATSNTALSVASLMWRERALTDSEQF